MRRFLIASLLSLLLCSIVVAQSGKRASAWTSYGKKITLKSTTSLSTLVGKQASFLGKEILTEGVIDEVCENKGCWMVVKNKDTFVRVEFKDYGFFMPWDSNGKKVKLQGALSEKTISKTTAEHMAEEMKNPPIAKDQIKDEQTIMVFVASGVSIEGGGKISAEQRDIIDGKKEKEEHKHEH